MAGCADNHIIGQEGARLLDGHVLAAKVNTICAKLNGKLDIIIDENRRLSRLRIWHNRIGDAPCRVFIYGGVIS